MDDISIKSIAFPKPDVILFTFQVFCISSVILTSLVNLTYNWGDAKLWTVLLTGSLGYIMPNPKLKTAIDSLVIEDTQKSLRR